MDSLGGFGFGNPQQNTISFAPTSTTIASNAGKYDPHWTIGGSIMKKELPQVPKGLDKFGGDWMEYLKELASSGDTVAIDRIFNYLMSEQSAQTARDWQSERDDHAYARLAADLRAAGFNPAFLMSNGGSPVVSQASGNSYGGNYASSYQNAAYRNEVYYKLGKGALANQRFGIIMNFLGTVVSSASHLAGAAIGAM